MNKDEINKLLDGEESNDTIEKLNKSDETHLDTDSATDLDDFNEPETLDDMLSEDEIANLEIPDEDTPQRPRNNKKISKKEKKSLKKQEKQELKEQKSELEKELKGVKKALKKRTRLKRFFKTIILLLLLSLLGGISFAAYNLYNKTDNALANAFMPRNKKNIVNENVDPIKDPISILILGVDNDDSRGLDSTRTDAMLLLTVSPKNNKITMTSIPRDTYTEINSDQFVGRGKINSAYAYGGIDSTIDAVEYLFAAKEVDANTGEEVATEVMPVNYYLTVDFQAFEKIIDALGGVEVDAKLPETVVEQNAKGEKVVELTNGKQKMSGETALAYARTRKVDNDVMRGSRQQQVLEAAIAKAMSIGSISKFQKVIEALDNHFWTDMDMTVMKKIAESGLTNSYKFDSYVFDWSGFDYNDESMVALHQDSLNYIRHKFRLNLGLDKEDPVMDKPDFKLQSNGIISQYTFPLDGQGVMN